MVFGDYYGLNFPDICLTGEKNPEKTSPRQAAWGERTLPRDHDAGFQTFFHRIDLISWFKSPKIIRAFGRKIFWTL